MIGVRYTRRKQMMDRFTDSAAESADRLLMRWWQRSQKHVDLKCDKSGNEMPLARYLANHILVINRSNDTFLKYVRQMFKHIKHRRCFWALVVPCSSKK